VPPLADPSWFKLDRRAVISGAGARTAALRGLIAAGINEACHIERVTAAFLGEGTRRHGEQTARSRNPARHHPAIRCGLTAWTFALATPTASEFGNHKSIM
jgi:hypothetical protein